MFKNFTIGLGIFFISIYILFLVLPFFLSSFINSFDDEITKMIEDNCGFKVKLENIRLLTTPKLTIGGGVGHFEVTLPNNDPIFTADNIQGKISLLPILARRIEFDMIGADNVNINLKVKKDGKFLLEDYIQQTQQANKNTSEQTRESTELPFGIKLSNHLPDIKVNNYNIAFVDIETDKAYSIYGDGVYVTDFVLDKRIKIRANGKIMLQDRVQFNYDFNLFNKIMPDINLHDLVFAQQPLQNKNFISDNLAINIIDVLKAIYSNQITADLSSKLIVSGTPENIHFDGQCNISNLSLSVDGKKLPASNADFDFKDNKIKMYTKLYSAQNETTELIGNFKTGKSPRFDLNCKSNTQFKSIIDMIDSIAKSFDYYDFDSLKATGGMDADFSIVSNMKKVESSGYFKIPSASLSYGLYNISLNDIKADIDFANSIVNIKDAGFSILGQPLKIKGTVTQDAHADLSVFADKLSLKGLLLAIGQMALLKENNVNSGTISLDVILKGKLDKILPKVDLSIDDVNIKNIPSNTTLSLAGTVLNLVTDGKSFSGDMNFSDAKAINPAASLSLPTAKLKFGAKDIVIDSGYALFEGVRINLSGKITDYLTETLKLDLIADGLGKIHLNGSISDLYKSQKLNLNLYTSKDISMPIPGFKGSNLNAGANVKIGGVAANPILKGTVNVPSITMPDMLLTLENMYINLNGPIVKGNGTLQKFSAGGIIAENLSADFDMKNNVFYLNKISGNAFLGKINGDISYNINDGHIGVIFNGSGMDAEKAIAGAAGIKNALSGLLGFKANLTLHGATDLEMMKNLKGKVTFEINDGELGNIGRFENLILAQNVLSNSIMKAAVNSISSLPAIKNTAKFKTIDGILTFSNGWANLTPIKTTGPSMAYYISGKYNLLNGTANVIILGRLAADVVALLGPVGELSVDKLTSFIPKFGNLTANLINVMTSDPSKERVDLIPTLSSGETVYKDFKVEFNGGVESKSSVKSFKWLSKCDTSAIEVLSVKEQIQTTKQAVKDTVQQKVDAVNDLLMQQRQQAQEAKQQLQNAKEGLKNLKNLLK